LPVFTLSLEQLLNGNDDHHGEVNDAERNAPYPVLNISPPAHSPSLRATGRLDKEPATFRAPLPVNGEGDPQSDILDFLIEIRINIPGLRRILRGELFRAAQQKSRPSQRLALKFSLSA
jgi:hypothetical protein